MSIVVVNSAAALNKALISAQSGETIELASGNYAGVLARNLHLSGVTITSQSATNQAVITGLNVSGSSGLSFTNLTMSAAANSSYYSFYVAQSSSIQFSNDQFTGSLAKNPTQYGLLFESDTNVTVKNSQFQQFATGIVNDGDTNVNITGNTFQQIDGDGIDNTNASSTTIANNTFTNFVQPSSGAHPDAIQFWTTGTGASASNITITGNTISAGSGILTQGIYLNDEAASSPFQNVTISNNTISGESYNAVLVEGVNNLSISGNTVTSNAVNESWIAITNVSNVSLTSNASTFFNIFGSVSNVVAANNLMNGTAQSDSVTSSASYNMIYAAPTSHNLTLTGTLKLNAWANSLGDHITGNNAGDTFYGGTGNDTLVGGTGNDTFNAGSGNDTMTGGAGTNTFVFGLTSANDIITDFHAGSHDVINLSAYINAGVKPVLQNSGSNVIIELEAGHSITLLGVQASQLVHTATGYTI